MSSPAEPTPRGWSAEPDGAGDAARAAARPPGVRPGGHGPVGPHADVPLTSVNTDDGDDRFDRLDGALAPYGQGRRGPLTLTLEIQWVDGPAADALRRTQARVLRDLLAALTPRPTAGQDPEDEQEAPA